MEPIKYFEAMDYLEPKCSKCSNKLEYGVTTEWNDKRQAHFCKNCGAKC